MRLFRAGRDLRINPESSWVDGVTHANVSAGSLSVALSRKDAESARHVLKLPFALLIRIVELGNTGEVVTTGGNSSSSRATQEGLGGKVSSFCGRRGARHLVVRMKMQDKELFLAMGKIKESTGN